MIGVTAAPSGRTVQARGRLMAIGALAFVAIAGFSALGVWQLERRAWKHDLIARVDARIDAAPVAAPGPDAWPTINRENDEYRRIVARGRFRDADETLVKAVTERGPGFWVMTPLVTDRGFTLLVNRGFVPEARRDDGARPDGVIEGETEVTGLLRISEPKGGFLRDNDPAGGRWFSRDVAAIAAAHGLTDTAPYFVDAEAAPGSPADRLPIAGLTVVSFPDNHLVYALTWFTLALMSAGAAFLVIRDDHRRRIKRQHD